MDEKTHGETAQHSVKLRHKVKTGCRTCKIRKVKCDEARPVCQRCLSTGRICDGYGIWGGGGNHYSQRTPSAAATASHSGVVRTTKKNYGFMAGPADFPRPILSDGERVALEWFCHRTVKKLPGVFGSLFWEKLVFQASLRSPVVFHAVLALGSAHKAKTLDFTSRDREGETPSADEIFTLTQYGLAINQLQEQMQANDARAIEPIRCSLISCLIFVFLEYSRGNFPVGTMHLENGLNLVQQVKENDAFATETDICVIELFERLRGLVQPLGLSPMLQSCSRYSSPLSPCLFKFRSSTEAKYFWDRLMGDIVEMTERAKEIPISNVKYRKLLEKDHGILRSALGQWYLSFEAALHSLDSFERPWEALSYHLLHNHYDMGIIMLETCFSSHEQTCFDRFTSTFVSILARAVEATRLAAKTESPAFSSGCGESKMLVNDATRPGWIHPLYFTAVKCRVHSVRTQAHHLLTSRHCEEGKWTSQIAAKVANLVIHLEEDEFYHEADQEVDISVDEAPSNGTPQISKVLPMEHRVQDVLVVLPKEKNGEVLVICKKMRENGEWDITTRSCE